MQKKLTKTGIFFGNIGTAQLQQSVQMPKCSGHCYMYRLYFNFAIVIKNDFLHIYICWALMVEL